MRSNNASKYFNSRFQDSRLSNYNGSEQLCNDSSRKLISYQLREVYIKELLSLTPIY
jgi:hypothetical protein